MSMITMVDPNILFNKIKNQFLAAIIGIIILIIVAITLILAGTKTLTCIHSIGIGSLLLVSLLAGVIVLKLNSAAVDMQKAGEQREQNMSEASHALWRLIVGLGEVCLESDVPDKKRIFVSDALSQVIENELEFIKVENIELRAILLGIKMSSDSEIKQNKTISMVLSANK